MNAIGIDIGTTGISGVKIDTRSGRVLSSFTKNSDAFLSGCAAWERIQSVDRIIAVAREILDTLLDESVAVIGVTGQMHGIVYYDDGGNAVSPLYTWQDGRGNLPYKDTTYAAHLGSFSGYGCVTDFYNRENGLRPRTAVGFCTIHDYFVMSLTGLRRPILHASDAASFGLYDLIENRLHYDLDDTVVTGYRIAGSYKNIPVSVAIGDNQASVFSTLADENGILLNVGTGSQVSILSDAPICAANIETRPYFEGKYLVVGSALCGGRAYSLLRDFYAAIIGYATPIDGDAVYGIMEKMLNTDDAPPLTVDTRFAGTRSDAKVTGSVTGITTEGFTPARLTRGFLCGISDELYAMYRSMNAERRGVVASGNGVRKNRYLAAILEERFGARLRVPAHLEEAAFGAALYGLISAGVYQNAREAQALIRYGEADA